MEKWETVRDLLGSDRVAGEVDVHVENKAGNTCLVLVILARLVLQSQSCHDGVTILYAALRSSY